MKKFPKPWYRPSRGLWYVTNRGKQQNLGPDQEEAFRRYHELMARPAETTRPPAAAVLVITDKFLEWCRQHRAHETYEWYRWRLQEFASCEPTTHRGPRRVSLPPLHDLAECLREPTAAVWLGVGQSFSSL